MNEAQMARELLRAAFKASLATLADDGSPYVSLVLVADNEGSPFFLLSDLAEHSKNLKRNPRASLLVEPLTPSDNPLAAARATLLGEVSRVDDDVLRARFVERHSSASLYAGFRDFAVYEMAVTRVHLVAGFGRIKWISRDEYFAV
jgi:putative heme iron utilization protein